MFNSSWGFAKNYFKRSLVDVYVKVMLCNSRRMHQTLSSLRLCSKQYNKTQYLCLNWGYVGKVREKSIYVLYKLKKYWNKFAKIHKESLKLKQRI